MTKLSHYTERFICCQGFFLDTFLSFPLHTALTGCIPSGYNKEKLLLGAAFYCHVYEGVTLPDPLGKSYASKGKILPHDALDGTCRRCWDEQAQAAYWLSGDRMLSGDDEQSLAAKRQFVLEEGLAGVIIWEMNHDRKNLLLPVLAEHKKCHPVCAGANIMSSASKTP